jgi:hypothetical protein
MQATCSALTKSGAPCRAPALASGWCVSHDPNRVVEIAEYRRRGGQAKSNRARARRQLPIEPMGNDELRAWITVAFAKAMKGQMAPALLNALSNAAKTMAELQRESTIEERMSEIERKLGSRAS